MVHDCNSYLSIKAPPPDAVISEEDRRLDRLTFWSVYFLDVSLSFGVGRETAFRLAAITQTIPAESDFTPPEETGGNGGSTSMLPVRSAFSYAARLAFAYGPLVNVLNGPWQNRSEWESQAQRITQQAVEVYNDLPPDMQWSAYKWVTVLTACDMVLTELAFRISRKPIKAQFLSRCIYGCTPFW